MHTVKVTQSASGKFAPDRAVFRIELRAEHKRSDQAAKALQQKRDGVLRKLAAAGLCEGEVTFRNAGCAAMRKEDKTVFCAYGDLTASLAVIDNRMQTVTAALEKSETAWRQSYELQDTSHRETLMAQAVAAAKRDALALVTAAGARLGALTGIEYAASFGGARVMRAMAREESVSALPEPIEVTETVTCEWTIE